MPDDKSQIQRAKSAEDVEIRQSLTAELFSPLGAAVPAYAAAILVAVAGVFLQGRASDYVCLAAIMLFTMARVGLLYAYRRQSAIQRTCAQTVVWEKAYGLLATLWTLTMGINCALLMLSDSVVVQLFGTIMAVGMTGGVAARHAPHPWIVFSQMVAILVPYSIAITWHYGYSALGLVLMTVFMFRGTWAATGQINTYLKLAMRSNIANRAIRDRFDTALNNMSHGLVMLDADMRMEVTNKQYAKMFGIDTAKLRSGLPLAQMIDLSMENYPKPLRTAQQYLDIFSDTISRREKCEKIFSLSDDSIIEFRFEPVRDGGTVLMMEDISEKQQAARKIEHLARYDALTGLPNRSYFGELLNEAIRKSTADCGFSLFYIDLDGFKEVNDTLGHPTGDKVLVEVGLRLAGCIRRTDQCCRIGGDEFIIIRSGTEGDEAFAARLIDQVSRPLDLETGEVVIGLSIGIARFGEDGNDGDELLRNADIALYKAKQAGKLTHRRFRPEMAAEIFDRHLRETDLRHAIQDDLIDVHFQPIVEVSTGRIVSCEALLRWFHPSRGLMSTEATIQLAESAGLICDLGAIVMTKACREAAAWPSDLPVAVNLSALQFRNGVVLQQIAHALSMSGLSPHRLEVEITESVALDNLAGIAETIAAIRALGVRVSLDDFGTGYTSLSYLHQIPFDKVKIDRSFVQRVETDEMTASLVHLVAALVKNLGKTMVVEGVETPSQVAVLRSKGCDYMQGYFFFKPQSGQELLQTLLRDKKSRLRSVA